LRRSEAAFSGAEGSAEITPLSSLDRSLMSVFSRYAGFHGFRPGLRRAAPADGPFPASLGIFNSPRPLNPDTRLKRPRFKLPLFNVQSFCSFSIELIAGNRTRRARAVRE